MDQNMPVGPPLANKTRIIKLVFLGLGVILTLELVFAIKTFTQPVPHPTQAKIITKGNVALLLPKSTYKVGDSLPVKIRLDTNNRKITSVDILLHFDPKILEASDSSITKGSLYKDYPVAKVDPKYGLVTISGLASTSQAGFSGMDILATVNFKAKAAGKTPVTVVFKSGSTTDSNMIDAETGKDILEKVIGLNLTIQ